MIEVFQNNEAGYLAWVENNPNGYVVNLDKTPGSSQYPMVHLASHKSLSSSAVNNFTTGDYFKVCSLDLSELEDWSNENRGKSLTWCETCRKNDSIDKSWSDEELLESVQAYLDMLDKSLDGSAFAKSDYYKALSSKFGRTTKAFEYRMQNISYVMSLLGRSWVPGLKPAKNVGANIAAKIEVLIAQTEGKNFIPQASFAIQTQEAGKKVGSIPMGNNAPRASVSTVTRFVRDPEVVAWVLNKANGICECCLQPAPFQSFNGPFLEVHHVRKLAEQGADTVSNAIAICPNCHRRLHYGIDAAELVERLYKNIERLRRYVVSEIGN